MLLTAGTCSLILSIGIFLGAQPQPASVKVHLRLIDAETGKSVAGIVRVTGADGKHLELPGLFDRMAGLATDLPGVHWYVVPAGGADATLPLEKLQIEALSGFET